jgi:hypothetical protein
MRSWQTKRRFSKILKKIALEKMCLTNNNLQPQRLLTLASIAKLVDSGDWK